MNSKIISELNNFDDNVNYIRGVDLMYGRISSSSVKLSCLEGLGLRSSHQVKEVTRSDFLREVIGKDFEEEAIIDLDNEPFDDLENRSSP